MRRKSQSVVLKKIWISKRQKEYKTFLICAIVCPQTLKNALNKGLYQTSDFPVVW